MFLPAFSVTCSWCGGQQSKLDVGMAPACCITWCCDDVQVNVMPSLASTSEIDRHIKNQLIADLNHMLGFVPYDRKQVTRVRDRARVRVRVKVRRASSCVPPFRSYDPSFS